MPGGTQSDNSEPKLDQSSKVEDLLPTDDGQMYKDEIDQFMQIINGTESLKKYAITIIEKTKGDINKALDIYYGNSENLGEKQISVQVESKIDRPVVKKHASEELRIVPDIFDQKVLKDNVDATHLSLPPEKYNPKEHGLFQFLPPRNIGLEVVQLTAFTSIFTLYNHVMSCNICTQLV